MKRHNFCIATLLLLIACLPARAADTDPNAGTISGTITGADGKPAAAREINLYSTRDDTPDPKTRQPKPVATVTTNDKGQYVMAKVPPGTYRMVAGIPFKEMALANVTVKAGGKVTVDLKLRARRIY
jgi:hypothetical protein